MRHRLRFTRECQIMVFTKQRKLKISLSKYFKTNATTGKLYLSRSIWMVTFEDYFHGLYNILDSVTGKNRSGTLEFLWRVTLHDLCKLLLLYLDFTHGVKVEPLVLTLGWRDNQLLAIYAVFWYSRLLFDLIGPSVSTSASVLLTMQTLMAMKWIFIFHKQKRRRLKHSL